MDREQELMGLLEELRDDIKYQIEEKEGGE